MHHKILSAPSLPRSKSAALPSAGQAGFWLMSTFCFVLVLRNSDAAVEYMGRGLTLCARTVIPSLFPFMVISELLVSSGAGEALGRLFSGIMRRVFGISGAGASACADHSAEPWQSIESCKGDAVCRSASIA